MHKIIIAAVAAAAIATPALANNVIDSFSGFGPQRVDDGFVFPSVQITPGTTANGPAIAVGNINFTLGLNVVAPNGLTEGVTGSITFTPNGYQAGSTLGQPFCFFIWHPIAGYIFPPPFLANSYTQDAAGNWLVPPHLEAGENILAADYNGLQVYSIAFFCSAKGPSAPPLP